MLSKTKNSVIQILKIKGFFYFRFDFDKFLSVIQDVKQGISERLRQWSEYEAQVKILIMMPKR